MSIKIVATHAELKSFSWNLWVVEKNTEALLGIAIILRLFRDQWN